MTTSMEPGLERTDEFVVEGRLLTDVGGTLEASVLSTPGMIGMMERTAAMLAFEQLLEGQATVGFEVCIKHVAARPRALDLHRRPHGSTRSSTAASCASTSRCAKATGRIGVGHPRAPRRGRPTPAADPAGGAPPTIARR